MTTSSPTTENEVLTYTAETAKQSGAALDKALNRMGKDMIVLARFRSQTAKQSKSGKPMSFSALSRLVESKSAATSTSVLGRYSVAEQAHTALTFGKGEGDNFSLMTDMVSALSQSDKLKRPTGEELSHLVAEALVSDKDARKSFGLVYSKWVKANQDAAKAAREEAAANKPKASDTDEVPEGDEAPEVPEGDKAEAPSLGKGDTSGAGDTGSVSISEALSTALRMVTIVTERITPAEASLYKANVAALSLALDTLTAKVA